MHRSSDFDGMIYRVGADDIIKEMSSVSALPIFSEEACEFLSELSKVLLALAEAKAYADVITFAFWCRKSALKRMAESYIRLCEKNCHPAQNRIGRGVAFHIAPSNVPVNFAYTLAVGLLSGNANIVKPPSANFPQTEIIANAIALCLDAHPEMKPYIALVQYDRQREITDALSALCNTRIIWGGDETVTEIRKSPLLPRATELTFPNRHSLLVIDAEGYLAIEDKDAVAADFFNDTFLTDQNACSSPRMVVWACGQNGAAARTSSANNLAKDEILKKAKRDFWSHAANTISQRYELQPAQAVKKLTESYLYSAAHRGVRISMEGGNLIYRIKTESISADVVRHYGDSGYFFEYDMVSSLDELLPLLGTSFQTLSYLGMPAEVLRQFVMDKRPRGVDRIVPMGHVMDFGIVWDGYDLIGTMSRVVDVVSSGQGIFDCDTI